MGFPRRKPPRGITSDRLETLLRAAGTVPCGVPPREKSCDGKTQYSEGLARRVAREESERLGDVLEAYRCFWCPAWHIGHRSTYYPKS